MLPLPPLDRRPIDRLKSNRSLKVHKTKANTGVEKEAQEPKDTIKERRSPRIERREDALPVAFERRKSDRRRAFLRNSRQMREILSNSGLDTPSADTRQGMFVNEEV